ncbi:hypothetical protein I4U23_008826 [Adineta vaga]|nr:hypothetical protein I4U23_008826 [Adineta vaga]
MYTSAFTRRILTSHNMFEGYYGRRRLKNVFMLFLGLIILLALYYRQRGTEHETSPLLVFNVESKTAAPPVISLKKSGVMSTIDFINSPYLDLTLFSTDIVPVMILSQASNIEVRDAIRRTWGFFRSYRKNNLRLKIFFLVGTDDRLKERIRMEQNVFDDVIQVSVPDMYSFIAHKELSAMIWVRSYLPKNSFYVKTEDDVILNTRVFVDDFLPLIESVYNQDIVIGWFGTEHHVKRGAYQKFIDAVLPPTADDVNYAMSLLYAVTSSAADRMINALDNIELIEYPGDPFVTGILRDNANVQITNLATTSYKLQYEIANGLCEGSFTRKPDLLICTSSLHAGSTKSMTEYFNAWNILIGET